MESLSTDLKKESKRTDAERSLAAVSDPRAVPSILRVFGPKNHTRTLQLLGQIDSVAASRSIALLAVFGNTPAVRRVATETLRMRDPREYADLLIGMLGDPINYQVKPVNGAGSTGELLIEGKEFDRKRLYHTPTFAFQPGTDRIVGYDAMGAPIIGRYLGSVSYVTSAGQLLPQLFPGASRNNGLAHAYSATSENQLVESLSQGIPISQRQASAGLLRGAVDNLLNPTPLQNSMNLGSWYQPTNTGPLNTFATLSLAENMKNRLNSGSNLTMTANEEAYIPLRQYQVAARQVETQLERDAATLESYNRSVRASNSLVAPVLNAATGQDLPEVRKSWRDWWVDQLGYRSQQQQSQSRPTYFENFVPGYVPQIGGIGTQVTSFTRLSCFGAGTLVKTLDGSRRIESIAVGDRVLSQDPETGALSYQAVLVVHHNPPSKTLKVQVGDEPIVASTFHRFWVAGHGWKMARELKAGDSIRTLDGRETVVAVDPEKVQPVYNLDVAGGHTFFVGNRGTLVHDNSVPGTRDAIFDAVDEPQTVAATTEP